MTNIGISDASARVLRSMLNIGPIDPIPENILRMARESRCLTRHVFGPDLDVRMAWVIIMLAGRDQRCTTDLMPGERVYVRSFAAEGEFCWVGPGGTAVVQVRSDDYVVPFDQIEKIAATDPEDDDDVDGETVAVEPAPVKAPKRRGKKRKRRWFKKPEGFVEPEPVTAGVEE